MEETMDKATEEKLEGLIIKAIQAGKKETSSLVADLKSNFLNEVRQEIKTTVNGKLEKQDLKMDNLKDHLKNQDDMFKEIKTELHEIKTEQ